ncbi:MAG: aminotransferase class I/II-fold pyridoxal phosphate-dependent enzyme [Spirosomaceae bacterium]|nr:aminotransferase class I/II-fold pyridoxal phosphate-dependent enzyme [Spirosomataceae bacterium]
MTPTLKTAYNPENFRQQAHSLVDQLADYLEKVQSQPNDVLAIPFEEPESTYEYWKEDYQAGKGEVSDFYEKVIEKSVHIHHPRYMGHQVSPPLPIAAATSMLTALLNNGMAVYEMGLVSNPLERLISEIVAKRIGYDDNSGGLLTSGGTLANLTALLAARANKTSVWSDGNDKKLAVMVSEEAHYCIDRAARIMGMGTEGIIKIPSNEKFQLRAELLEEYLEEAKNKGFQVICIVGSACSTSTGSYDDLNAIADFAEKHDIWFHVDGAHGAAVVFSEKYNYLVAGLHRADSMILDWHKMLMVPALATSLIFKRNADSYRTFQQKAQYLWDNQDSKDWFNSGKRTFECTKLMMSVKIYSIIKAFGEEVFTENVNYLHDLARTFSQMIQQSSDFELPVVPQSNIVCFRYIKAEEENSNKLNSTIRQQLLTNGRFYVVQTTLNEEVYLRVSLMNALTTENHLRELLKEIGQIAERIVR